MSIKVVFSNLLYIEPLGKKNEIFSCFPEIKHPNSDTMRKLGYLQNFRMRQDSLYAFMHKY